MKKSFKSNGFATKSLAIHDPWTSAERLAALIITTGTFLVSLFASINPIPLGHFRQAA
ncbi:hypothetical protein [Pedobacter agri]|uniref:hypothetical protein n=1 Tax=Pedobacter agri TaxID=454586 RepID=UPI002784477C|nr:hypothetical protein [Pedobacter agri]MDQ1142937.1 hypothetical protein [Pedobacter agri]